LTLAASGRDHKADRNLAEDRRLFYHPCFATRLGGVLGGKETQGWRDSSHTAMVGAGKFGSAKLPMATATAHSHVIGVFAREEQHLALVDFATVERQPSGN